MILLLEFFGELWDLFTEMAPYLLLGFIAAGILHVLLRPHFVERLLGKRGWRSNLKATVLGIPLPVCSCGVLPLAASIKREGASSGSTLAFLTATPQTGVDSILATQALMGPVFTGFRVGVAFVSGWLTGAVVDFLEGRQEKGQAREPSEVPQVEESCCSSEREEPRNGFWKKGKAALKYGFLTLPEDLSRALLVGLMLAAVIGVWMPVGWIESNLSNLWLTYLLMTVIAIPIYVCSTGSIPLAFAFLKLGISPGAALVFLIAGPATNAATLSVIWKQMGPRLLMGFLGSLVLCAWSAGWILDQLPLVIDTEAHHHHGGEISFWFQQVCGVFLAAVLLWATFGKSIRRLIGTNPAEAEESCCSREESPKESECRGEG
jgi:hypothetical protein